MKRDMDHDSELKKRVLLVFFLVLVLVTSMFLNRVEIIRMRSDIFLRWYATDKMLTDGRGIYDDLNGEEVLEDVYGDQPVRENTNFYYPAYLLVFTIPLALFSYDVAHLLWTVFGQFAYFWAIWLTMKKMNWPQHIVQRSFMLLGSLFFIPYIQHALWSQFNTIGVISLVGAYFAIKEKRLGLGGILLAGLTIKLQATLLPLIFFLIWALVRRERWQILFSFAGAMIALWGFAEFFQQNWVSEFYTALGGYVPVISGLDAIQGSSWLLSIGLVFLALFFVIANRDAGAESDRFLGCLVFSIGIWSLVVPIAGMMHVVLLPVAIILLLAGLRDSASGLYFYALVSVIGIYFFGWGAFFYGLWVHQGGGNHLFLSELTYKTFLPLLTAAFALPLIRGPLRS